MVTLVRHLWTEPTTTFHGRVFEVIESPMVGPEPVHPRLLLGGGGRRVMGLGGQVADTVSMIPRQTTGAWSVADSVSDSTPARMAEKAAWVRQGAQEAGRDPDDVELNTMVANVIVGADPGPRITQEASDTGITPAQMTDSTLYLCGTGPEVCDRLQRWRQEIGLSYLSLFDPGDDQLEYFAEQVGGRLGGQ
jgi:alkanesulfonate monooxygenase SsuD/methylene tetrahydromethanopterin reductase-like flavin-dependent oxidoreductase (luciferase family)